jgi:hypothetical protein
MKLFAIAFGIACGVGVFLFATTFASLALLGIEQSVPPAAALGALPITAFPKIAEFLERQEGRKNVAAGKGTPVYDFREFQIAWPLMVLYGCLILTGVSTVVAGLTGAAGIAEALSYGITETSLIQQYFEENVALWLLGFSADFLVGLPVMYFLGRWIGTRCAYRGVVAVVLIVSLMFGIGTAIILLDPEPKVLPKEWRHLLTILNFAQIPFYLGFGLIGYWRGGKLRLSKYLHYLLDVLPSETRDTVVELAFDEARKAAGRARISTL